MFKNLFAKLAGKWAAKKIGIGESTMEEKKPWYKSKGILTGIVVVVLGAYNTTQVQFPQFHLPAVPDFLYAFLGAFGIYARATAKAEITKTDETAPK
jgi:hypothetical protein